MSIASHNMYSAVKDAYEVNWVGYSDVLSAVEVGPMIKFEWLK